MRWTLDNLNELLTSREARRVMVFHGASSYRSSGAQVAVNALGDEYALSFVPHIPENPELHLVKAALQQYGDFQPDTLLAIGGGSVIDTAKAVLAMAGGSREQEVLANRFSLPYPKPIFLAVPTTAGSGAEATHFAVLYKDGHKYSLAHADLQPDFAVLDPRATTSCPLRVTLSAGADAVCQAIESWWRKAATAESREYSLQALPLLLSALAAVVDQPTDLSAREAMQQGAHLSGRAINITKTTAGHALSYSLTTHYGVPHGLAVLLIMQRLIPIMQHDYGWKSPELDAVFADTGWGEDLFNGFSRLCEFIWNHQVSVIETPASAPGPQELSSLVNLERLQNHPLPLHAHHIQTIYTQILREAV